jgi:hypothetical protein
MATHDFLLLQAYLRHRIAISGAGKCYIEYPLSQQVHDGIKRLPQFPENMFELRFDAQENNILLIQAEYQAYISADTYDDSQVPAAQTQRFADALHYIYTLAKNSPSPSKFIFD